MAAAATIAAAAIGAAGAIGGGILSSKAAGAAAGGGSIETIPLPGYASAINHIAARNAVLNQGKVAPSFGEYVSSGGTATFPWESTGLTPNELVQLGFVGKQGKAIPFGDPHQKTLTPEQRMFLGGQRYWNTWVTGTDVTDPAGVAFAKAHGLPTIQPKSSGGGFLGTLLDLGTFGQGQNILGGSVGTKNKTPAKKGY